MTAIATPVPPTTVRRTATARPRSYLDQWFCLCTYPVVISLLTLTMFLVGPFLPPISPSATPSEVAAIYLADSSVIAIPIIVLVFTVGVQVPLQGLVIDRMRQMPNRGKLLSWVYLVSYAGATLPSGGLLVAFFGCAVLRPDRDPAALQALNDLAFLGLIAVISGFLVQYAALALAIFLDRGRIMPLWFGYVSVWATVSELLFVPGYLIPHGPFAWNGLLDFWLGLGLYGVWAVGLVLALRQTILKQQQAELERSPALLPVEAT
ncbi:MAG: hypothetical protein JHC95_01475 [Solirubrobacteraceae bacterium]|nr:hypothetical protein [Solirubrobacteraceae bacterium]